MKSFLTSLPLAASLVGPAVAQQPALQVDWKQSPINGHWYGVDYTPRSWTESEALAVSLGGHLVTIRSQGEQDWIEQTVSPYWPPVSALHIGLNDAASEGTFLWSSGEPVTFTNWGAGEPNDLGGEDYASISGPGSFFGLWNDGSSSFVTRPLIELPTKPDAGWSWPQIVPTGVRPIYGCLADLDGDGDLDYASPDAEEGSGTTADSVSIHWNDGAGNFSAGQVIQVPAEPRQLVSLDLDQDGDLDLVYACEQGQDLGWLANDGFGGFASAQSLDNGLGFHGLTVADINGDGVDDLLAVTFTFPGRVIGYYGLAGGGLGPATLIDDTGGDLALFVTTGDLNGDGAVDLVVDYYGSNRVSIYLNDGTGQFPQRLDLATGLVPYRCSLADLDLDGDLDLLVPALGADRLEVWHNDGAGGFQKFADYPAGNGPHDSTTTDVDGDGVPDVIVPSYLSDDVRIFHGDGLGGLIPGEVFTGHDYALWCATGDLDSNGSPDLVIARFNAASLAVWKNHRVFDCDANGIPDPDDIAADPSIDCNGNGRPDSCDLTEPGADVNLNGILDVCEPVVASVTPAFGAGALGETVTLELPNVPDGIADLVLPLPGGDVVVPITVVGEAATADIPPLGFGSAVDVTVDAFVRWVEGGVEVATDPLPSAFTWEVPQVVAVTPNAVPFDGLTPVVIELAENVVTSGIGVVRFGDAPAQVANFFQGPGTTYVATNAPPQLTPGDYPIELEITSGGVTEFARVEARALVFLGPGIASISAIEGFQGGGEPVTFELVDFQPGVPVEVAFGDAVTSGVPTGFLAASSLTVFTPTSPVAGVVDVTLTQDLGGGAVKTVASPAAFEFLAPTVGDLSATSGPQAGGELLSASTEGFAPGDITIEMGGVTTTGVVVGAGASQVVDWTTLATLTPGLTDVRFTQGVFDVTKSAAYEYRAPSLASVSPADGAWYQGQTLTVTGADLAPHVAADVTIEGEAPLAATVLSGSQVEVSVPAEWLVGNGPLDVTVSQAGIDAVLADGFTVLPSLEVTVNGDAVNGGTIDFQIASLQSGFGYVLLATGPSPFPLPIQDFHGAFALDFATALNLGSGGLILTPTLSVPFSGGYPPGTTVSTQGLALEFGPAGTFYSFTQVEPVVIP